MRPFNRKKVKENGKRGRRDGDNLLMIVPYTILSRASCKREKGK